LSIIDLDTLMSDVSPDAPCGEDLAYDPQYVALFTMAEGTPERQVGDSVIPAEEPDWRQVRDSAVELLRRTKDLRVTLELAVALLRLEGLPGLRDGLSLLHTTLDKHWEGVHPVLDPDDAFDPTERMNIIGALATPPGATGDPMRIQARLREAPLTDSRQFGRYSLRDIDIAKGDVTHHGDGEAPTLSAIAGAFSDTEAERLQELHQAASEAIEFVDGIDRVLTERAGAANAPDLQSFKRLLSEAASRIADALSERGYGQPGQDAAEEQPSSEGGAPVAHAVSAPGEIRSRQDVVKALDRICEYYEKNEPSSPVPLLLKRAQRLATKSFLDIVKDLSPDAIAQIEIISGTSRQDGDDEG